MQKGHKIAYDLGGVPILWMAENQTHEISMMVVDDSVNNNIGQHQSWLLDYQWPYLYMRLVRIKLWHR